MRTVLGRILGGLMSLRSNHHIESYGQNLADITPLDMLHKGDHKFVHLFKG